MSLHVAENEGQSLFVAAADGLRLHVRQFGMSRPSRLPVVCLPGLSRTVGDFDVLAPALANDTRWPRRVIAIDSRGRGRSDYDRDPQNYNVSVELADVMAVLSALDIGRAVCIGSSRGGILTMLMAAARPSAIAGAVLHDIGPVIEPAGVARIKSYVGKLPQPHTFDDGAAALRRLFAAHFPKVTTEQWLAAARRTWQSKDGKLEPSYDVRIAETLAALDVEQPLPPLWNEFDALAGVPVMVIRGALSDILSAETVKAMSLRHPGMQTIEVPDQGHVPLLEGEALIAAVAAFVAACDDAASARSGEVDTGSDKIMHREKS